MKRQTPALILAAAAFISLGIAGNSNAADSYKVDGNSVTWHGTTLAGADAATFSVLNDHIAKDKNRAYCGASVIAGVDAASLSAVDYIYAKDKNNVYHCDRNDSVSKKIENADPSTFRLVTDMWYAMDKNAVYHEGCWNQYCTFTVTGIDPETTTVVDRELSIVKDKTAVYTNAYEKFEGADPATFSYFSGSNYAKDKTKVFYIQCQRGGCSAEAINGADAATFSVASDGKGYASDKNYQYNNGVAIPNADDDTFEVLGDGYAKDKNAIYFAGKALTGADLGTFRVIGNNYAKDNSRVYYLGTLLEMADAGSFTAMRESANHGLDKNNMYFGGEIMSMSGLAIYDDSLYRSLKGKIVLKAEDKGEAYYVSLKEKKMHFLSGPTVAFYVLREQGIGISNTNLEKIPVGGSCPAYDQDCDANSRHDTRFANSQKGKIMLQVEKNGEAWYVNPQDGKRYFLGRPADAFNIMRTLSLGISNTNFDKLIGR